MRRWTRRQVAACLCGAVGALALSVGPRAASATSLEDMAQSLRSGIDRGPDGETRVFGLAMADADEILQRVTRSDALPATYAPGDLVSGPTVGIPSPTYQLIRAITAPDLRALVDAGAAEGHVLFIGSGYRSYGHQVSVFAAQVARRGGDEEAANRYSARPGHSQHQLGTTLDFNDTFRAFASSPAGQWLWANAHHFGFVFPYTEANQHLTGYVSEPWHGRWVGRGLAWWMFNAGYQDAEDFTADDVVAAVRIAAGLA